MTGRDHIEELLLSNGIADSRLVSELDSLLGKLCVLRLRARMPKTFEKLRDLAGDAIEAESVRVLLLKFRAGIQLVMESPCPHTDAAAVAVLCHLMSQAEAARVPGVTPSAISKRTDHVEETLKAASPPSDSLNFELVEETDPSVKGTTALKNILC